MKTIAFAFIAILLSLILTGSVLIHLSKANPVLHTNLGEQPPKPSTTLPTIAILSPKNNAIFGNNSVFLAFNVGPPKDTTIIETYVDEIYCTLDRGQRVYYQKFSKSSLSPLDFSDSVTLTGIPDGNHTVLVTAVYWGQYMPYSDPYTWASFHISGSSAVTFTVDTVAPAVSVTLLDDTTPAGTSITLNLRVTDQSLSWSGYSLDGKDNVTVNKYALTWNSLNPHVYVSAWTGNLTLAGLPSGAHNLVLYATDDVGHTGSSKPIHFTISQETNAEFQPTAFATVASISAIAAITVVSLTVYYLTKVKRRKPENPGTTSN